uniref:Organic cation transporter-related family protein n=1 Tax=Rhizophora mucronata TaxID=61149 RepID=A0A2P2IV13_RHIMU
MMDLEAGPSQVHADFGSMHKVDGRDDSQVVVVSLARQCQVGSASVYTLMNVCCPSNARDSDTRMD